MEKIKIMESSKRGKHRVTAGVRRDDAEVAPLEAEIQIKESMSASKSKNWGSKS